MRGAQLLGSPSITPRLPVRLRSSRSCAQEPSIDEVRSIDRQPAVADRLQIRLAADRYSRQTARHVKGHARAKRAANFCLGQTTVALKPAAKRCRWWDHPT